MLVSRVCLLTTSIANLAAASPTWFTRSPPANSTVSCAPFVPVGFTTNKAKIYFYDNNPNDTISEGPGLHAPTLPANATTNAKGQFFLSDHTLHAGQAFTLQACNVSSPLNYTSPQTQSSCSHGGCYTTYYNYIRIRTTLYGPRCLTVRDRTADESVLGFKKCDAFPQTRDQWFIATQQILYPTFGTMQVGDVDFENVQDFDEVLHERKRQDGGSFYAWGLSRTDNKTVETVHFDYTQMGLSAKLIQP